MAAAASSITYLGTVRKFLRDGTWSQAIMGVVDASFDHPLKLEEDASAPLAGGIMQHGYQCGMLWGAALAAGAEAYQRYGPGPQAETAAIMASEKILDSFQARTGNKINCIDIIELNWQAPKGGILKFLAKGGPIGCFHMAGKYGPEAVSTVESALAEEPPDTPSPPVSCAAVLARKMGASDLHAAMAAGFAGGIGLSGGACGALGAAIWIITMNSKEGAKLDLMSPEGMAAIDRFVESSDYEFECSAIVGRKFEDVGDHAAYVHDGGCSEIIEALAAV